MRKGTKLYVVDSRFNRTAAVSDLCAPIRSSVDIAFLGALINWLLENDEGLILRVGANKDNPEDAYYDDDT